MASTLNYRDYILEQLAGLEEISCRAMMGSISSTTGERSWAASTTTACW